jgi:hypothetical protein
MHLYGITWFILDLPTGPQTHRPTVPQAHRPMYTCGWADGLDRAGRARQDGARGRGGRRAGRSGAGHDRASGGRSELYRIWVLAFG